MWKDITGHLVTLLLVIGFFSLALLSVGGFVNLQDPTTASFLGTVTGYAIGQLARPLAWYFNLPREPRPPGPPDAPS